MYNHSSKKQVQYSLEQLSKSLFRLMKNTSFERITVTDICRGTDITRRTYYRNCSDKQDLILYATDRLVMDLLEQVDFSLEEPQRMYSYFFSYWGEHREFLDNLYRNDLFDLFLSEFISVCNSHMRYPLQEQALPDSKRRELARGYSNAFIVGGLGQMLKKWTAEKFQISAGEVADSIVFLSPVKN